MKVRSLYWSYKCGCPYLCQFLNWNDPVSFLFKILKSRTCNVLPSFKSLKLIGTDCGSTKLFKVHSFIRERIHLKVFITTVSIKYYREKHSNWTNKQRILTVHVINPIHFAFRAMFVNRENKLVVECQMNVFHRNKIQQHPIWKEVVYNHFRFPLCTRI